MMIGVAGPASHSGVVLLQVSMQRGRALPLGDNICMADYTAIGHSGCLPECGMAGRAIAAKICMRAYPTEDCSRFGIQLTRTEKRAAAHQADPYHYQEGQQGRYHARNRQAAKRLFPHKSPLCYRSKVA
jgi:hypothetical protein